MIGLLQRVTEARVEVGANLVGAIGPGLLVLTCAQRGDTEAQAERLLERLLNFRVFSDVNSNRHEANKHIPGTRGEFPFGRVRELETR